MLTRLSTIRSYDVKQHYGSIQFKTSEESDRKRTKTTHTARQPFMSRFLWVIALTLGRVGSLTEGCGGFKVLYESYTFRKSIMSLRAGTNMAMVGQRVGRSIQRLRSLVLVVCRGRGLPPFGKCWAFVVCGRSWSLLVWFEVVPAAKHAPKCCLGGLRSD